MRVAQKVGFLKFRGPKIKLSASSGSLGKMWGWWGVGMRVASDRLRGKSARVTQVQITVANSALCCYCDGQTLQKSSRQEQMTRHLVKWSITFITQAVSCKIGSPPSDHYFRSVCLSVCLFVCLFVCAEFFSAVFDLISIKLGYMLYVWV